MANLRADPVGYRPLRVNPILQDGQLGIARDDGAIEARVAAGFQRLGLQAGGVADQLAAQEGAAAGRAAAAAGAPGESTISGGVAPGTSSYGAESLPPLTPTGSVFGIVDQAAARHGQDAATLKGIAWIESNGRPGAKNPRSSAGGLFQFIDSTAKAYGLTNRFDAGQASDAGARLLRDNRNALKKALGREPSAGELYLAHQQGAGGAIKLLRNPNASAASVVGQAAVGLNGGKAGMTAGQFAQLWTKKGDKAAARFGGAAVGPAPAGEPVDAGTAPGIDPGSVEEGSSGSFRPMSDLTIRGRAFNEAGTRDYLNRLDAVMRREVGEVYDRFGDDPEVLDQRLKDLRSVHMRGHVFPEIEADYDIAYERLTQPYRRQARDAARSRMEEIDRAAFMERTAELETEQARMVAGFDPAGEDTASALLAQQAAIDRHYDDAVARGLISPEDGVRAKVTGRQGLASGFYTGQAQAANTPEDVLSMRDTMRADFAAGKLDGVDAAAWQTIDAQLVAIADAKRVAQNKAVAQLEQQGKELVDIAARGGALDAESLSVFQLSAQSAPGGAAIVETTLQKIRAAEIVRVSSLDAGAAYVRSLETEGAAAGTGVATFAREQYEAQVAKIATDPIGAAEDQRIIPPQEPILTEGAGIEDLATRARERVAVATSVARHYGTEPKFLTAEERRAMVRTIQAQPELLPALTEQLYAGFGENLPQALAELQQDGPLIAHAAGLAHASRSPTVLLELSDALRIRQGEGYQERLPSAAKVSSVAGSALGGALARMPQVEQAAIDTATILFEKRARSRGLDLEEFETAGTSANDLYRRSLDDALGGRFVNGEKFGGLTTVNGATTVAPTGMRADALEDLVLNVTPEALEAQMPIVSTNDTPLTARQLRGASLVAVGDGLYRVAVSDPFADDPRFLMTEGNTYFVLDAMALARWNAAQPAAAGGATTRRTSRANASPAAPAPVPPTPNRPASGASIRRGTRQ